jgi:hypothetical protein
VFDGWRSSVFDLARDPGERVNVDFREPLAEAALRAALGAHLGRHGAAPPAATAAFDAETLRQLSALGYVATPGD